MLNYYRNLYKTIWKKTQLLSQYFRNIINKILIKFFFITLFLLAMYYKPFYTVLFLLLFSFEYIFLIGYIIEFFSNLNGYYKINPVYIELCEKNITQVWLEYCKLEAFRKFYTLFANKKKITIYVCIKFFIIFILGIPLKILKLFYYFIFTNEGSFRDGLECLYVILFHQIKFLKIEILNKKIYLNQYTISQLIKLMRTENPLILKNQLFNTLKRLQIASMHFQAYEIANKRPVKLYLANAVDTEGVVLFTPHFVHFQDKNSIHPTSFVPIKLLPSQESTIPMPSAIKPDALNPGTVISKEAIPFLTYKKYIWVPKYELDVIKIKYPKEFPLDAESGNYITEKGEIYNDILKNGLKIDKVNNKLFLENLQINNYSNALNTSNIEIKMFDLLLKNSDDFL